MCVCVCTGTKEVNSQKDFNCINKYNKILFNY